MNIVKTRKEQKIQWIFSHLIHSNGILYFEIWEAFQLVKAAIDFRAINFYLEKRAWLVFATCKRLPTIFVDQVKISFECAWIVNGRKSHFARKNSWINIFLENRINEIYICDWDIIEKNIVLMRKFIFSTFDKDFCEWK